MTAETIRLADTRFRVVHDPLEENPLHALIVFDGEWDSMVASLFDGGLRRCRVAYLPLKRSLVPLAFRVLRASHRLTFPLIAASMSFIARHRPQAAEKIRTLTYRWFLIRLAQGITVTARRQGVRLSLNLSGNLERCLYFSGTYEDDYLRFLESEVRPGDTYIDIGAHIGLDAFVVAKAIRTGRVVCFEPSSDTADVLRQGIVTNGLQGLVEVVEVGLANETGTLELRADPDFLEGDSAVRSRYNSGAVVASARLRRFDDWATEDGLARMDVVKLDIEGCEYDALLGMAESLRRLKPRSIIVELGEVRLRQAGTTAHMIDDLLGEYGYVRTGQVMLDNVAYRQSGITI